MTTRDGVAFNGRLTLDGVTIGDVENTGTGGPTDVAVDKAHVDAVNAEAMARYPNLTGGYAALEESGEDLATIAELSRARGITFVTQPAQLVTGEFGRFKAGVPLAAAVQKLIAAQANGEMLDPHIFDKDAGCFRPLAEFTTHA